jgi:uncharacterized protein
MTNEFAPVKTKERIELLDALRGFAIFGILMVNLPMMYEPAVLILAGAKPDPGTAHIIAEAVIKFFFEGKFYVIFSVLFGLGFWMFMNKSGSDGKKIVPIYRRRLFFLLLFGVAHVSLLWAGDILVFYAIFGFILLLFRKSSDKKVFRWAVVLALIPGGLTFIMFAMYTLSGGNPEVKAAMDSGIQQGVDELNMLIERAGAIYSGGSFSEIVSIRLAEYRALLPGVFFFYPVVMAMFLIGFLTGRRGYLHNSKDHHALFTRVFRLGLILGIVFNALYVISFRHSGMGTPSIATFISTAMHTLGGISFGFAFIAGFAIMFNKGRYELLKMLFAPIGKMALTNYLMHSVIAVFLFHSYGLGLFGKIQMWQGIIITIIIFTFQIVLSNLWLRYFRYGPMEYLWRVLTYGKSKV